MSDPISRLNAALTGRYAIEQQVGEGGMATVYLANDVKHGRKVALKVLKPELAAVVGAERFLAEIKTTANLQHPHILSLYDSGEADGFLYYVMPYVEGESLRDRIDRDKQLPIDEAVGIAVAVASALDYAHRNDVIHRDIKPANILLHDGQPVVADFGIALAVQEAGGGRLTETGLSLGTPYYMSPEQATADRDPSPASDVYSVGCVLYEMLTGEPPFTGSTAQAVLGRILTAEVVLPTQHRKSIPEHVERVLLKSLEKLPADRFQSAADFVDTLKDPARLRSLPPGPARGRIRRSQIMPWGLFLIALAALFYNAAAGPAPISSDAPVIRAVLELPTNMVVGKPNLSISEDGRRIAVVGFEDGVQRIIVRDLAALSFTGLPNTDGADMPFLSPDGSQVAFRAGSMRRVSTAGGPATVIDADAAWAAGDWTADGTLYYSRSYKSGIWRKSGDGGPPEMITQPDSAELAHWHPQLMPDGEHLLFTAFRTPIDSASIAVVDVSTGERRTVLPGAVFGRYVPTGHLLFARENTIFAIGFEPATMETRGQAVPIVEDVAMAHVDGVAAFDVSGTGIAIYVRASEYDAPSDLVWIDRMGNQTSILPEPGVFSAPALSPDERSIAMTMSRAGEATDVWVLDLVRGALTPLTVGGGADFQPVWTPDGRSVVYASERPVFDLFWRRSDGSASPEPLLQGPFDKYPFSFTPDGSRLLFEMQTIPDGSLRSVTLDEARANEAIAVPAEGDLSAPALSPDGRFLAFSSNESGRAEVYVVSYPDKTERRQASLEGGEEPRWTKGGRELVFRRGNGILALTVDPDSGELGTPRELFQVPMGVSPPSLVTYDVTADGERFVTATRPPERSPRRVIVITNFFAELRRLVPN